MHVAVILVRRERGKKPSLRCSAMDQIGNTGFASKLIRKLTSSVNQGFTTVGQLAKQQWQDITCRYIQTVDVTAIRHDQHLASSRLIPRDGISSRCNNSKSQAGDVRANCGLSQNVLISFSFGCFSASL